MKILDFLKPKIKLIRELDAKQIKIDFLSQKNETLSSQNAELESQKRELESQIAGLNLEIARKNDRIKILSKNMQLYMRKLIEKSRRIIDLNTRIKEIINDPLSGLYSRRVLEEMENMPEETIYIMFDIDKFKEFNDTLSHKVGDKVIEIIGSCVKKVITRQSDFSIRYGGDEFVIILPLCTIEKAKEKCEALKELISISCKEIELPKNVTITIGMYYNELESNLKIKDGIHRADLALKRGKKEGRNKLVLYDNVLDREEKPIKDEKEK